MRVFLTGATGFIASRIVPELLGAGHAVLGLTRSEAGVRALEAAGAEAHRGDLEDLDSLRGGAAVCDGVIHTAFDHDFSSFEKFAANCDKDRRAIEALGSALGGTDRPLVITSGTGMGSTGHGNPAREDVFDTGHPNPRILSERTGAALLDKGVNVSVMRLPQVHDTVKQGLITYLVAIARDTGVSAYVGDGSVLWPAAHVLDVARCYRLALEARTAGARYHAVAEEGIPMRDIAEVIGRGLRVATRSISGDEAAQHFGWMAAFAQMDMRASSALTRARLGWSPNGPGLIVNLEAMRYEGSPAS